MLDTVNIFRKRGFIFLKVTQWLQGHAPNLRWHDAISIYLNQENGYWVTRNYYTSLPGTYISRIYGNIYLSRSLNTENYVIFKKMLFFSHKIWNIPYSQRQYTNHIYIYYTYIWHSQNKIKIEGPDTRTLCLPEWFSSYKKCIICLEMILLWLCARNNI